MLISLKDKGGREEIRDVQILKAVASKSGQPSLLGLNPQKESANTITVAHLKQAWEEVFVPGLLKHRPELKQQLLASVSKQEALNSPVRPYGEGEGVAADGTPVVVKGTQMHIWSLDWQDPRQAIAEGYDIINILDANAYVVPNGTGNIGAYGDDLNTKPIYETWTPGNFKKRQYDWSIDPNHPRLLGAAWAVWNDNSFMTDPGLCGRDLLPMIQKNCAVFAQKTWSPTNDAPYGAFLKMVQAQAPFLGTTPPSAWERTFTVTVQAGLHCLDASDELALYAVTPHDGKVGFRREGAYYSFDVTLECGKQYELTFASKDRKASVTVRPLGDAQAKPTTYDTPQRQYFPASCRYFTLPPLN